MALSTILATTLMCPMGSAPCSLVVLPVTRTIIMVGPPATMVDFAPMLNIMSFGMCMSPANPTVAAATAAALGVLTPMPCIPATTPWAPSNPTVIIGGIGPAVSMTGMVACVYGGVITQTGPAQASTIVPI